ncbi:MAG: hypothetical protein KDC26_10330 [Armatimonadetes bacterium]|nr:hypothetical protein [Armatimonadota bacterium]
MKRIGLAVILALVGVLLVGCGAGEPQGYLPEDAPAKEATSSEESTKKDVEAEPDSEEPSAQGEEAPDNESSTESEGTE